MPAATLAERAAALGYETVALTDRNGIYGAMPFVAAAQRAGVRALVGAEIAWREGGEGGGFPGRGNGSGNGDGTAARGATARGVAPGAARESVAVLLPRDRAGFAALCRVLTARHLEAAFDLAEALDACGAAAGGLHVIVEEAALARRLREVVGREALWIEATPRAGGRFRPGAAARLAAQVEAAAALGVRPVATGRAHLLDPGEHPLHELLVAIREQSMPGDPAVAAQLADADDSLRAPAELERLLAGRGEARANARAIAEECAPAAGLLRADRAILPRAPTPEGWSEARMLRARCAEGLRRRYGGAPEPAVEARLERELGVILEHGFAGYFLIVGEIARFARSRGIPVVGRGSGASSLVAYLLGVTSVDPIRHELLFERFLNPRRPDLPDLDVDFCWKRRDEVIEHVYETYGRDRVAMIATHVTYSARSAFRDAARAVGVPLETVNRLAKRVPRDPAWEAGAGEQGGALAGSQGAGAVPAPGAPAPAGPALAAYLAGRLAGEIAVRADPWPRVLAAAAALSGFPRHLGLHCGGIVVADRPLAELVPLERAAKGVVVTQYEMRAVEWAGLVKIDLLGNRALSEVAEALALAAGDGGVAGEAAPRRRAAAARAAPRELDGIPDDDPLAGRLLARAETLGCFQIESPGMRNLLAQLRTASAGETIAAHSLIRPGPAASGMKDLYVRTARGASRLPAPPHPEVGELLAGTRGVMLYEEDVMRVAAWLVGGDVAEGDEIRRAIQGARGEELGEVGEGLIARALARGLAPRVAEEVWQGLRRFAAYSFCKAHAAGYGMLAYQTAWLKAHYPAPFAVSVMNHHQGMYPKRAHLADARRLGVGVRGPCVNRSAVEWTLEEGEMRVGLMEVKGLGQRAQEAIVAEARRRPFASLGDFLARVPLTVPEAESLILVGAFDFTGERRPALVWALRTGEASREARAAGAVPLFAGLGGGDAPPAPRPLRRAPPLPDFGPEERLRHEWEILELALTMHPCETVAARLLAGDAVPSAGLAARAGRRVALVGVPVARRRVRTKRGELMLFLTLEDAQGLAECTLFPPVYRRVGRRAHADGLLRVSGVAEDHHGAITVNVEALETHALFEGGRRYIAADGGEGEGLARAG